MLVGGFTTDDRNKEQSVELHLRWTFDIPTKGNEADRVLGTPPAITAHQVGSYITDENTKKQGVVIPHNTVR